MSCENAGYDLSPTCTFISDEELLDCSGGTQIDQGDHDDGDNGDDDRCLSAYRRWKA
jgi:hypothetical protein